MCGADERSSSFPPQSAFFKTATKDKPPNNQTPPPTQNNPTLTTAHYAEMPVSKGGLKMNVRQKEAYGLPGGDGASSAAALLADDADPVTNRDGFLFFAEDLLPVRL